MTKIPDLRGIPDLPPEIAQSALEGGFVLFLGSGVSMLVGLPSWGELAWKTLEDLRQKGCTDYSELQQLAGLDPKRLLSIANNIASENGIHLDYQKHLTHDGENIGIYDYLNRIGCVCVTTNYDDLLKPRFQIGPNPSVTPYSVTRISKREEFHAGRLDNPGTVVHLHGSISEPTTMILTTDDYLKHYDDAAVQNFLKELFHKKTVLFMGYGLDEAEILEHILRRAGVKHTEEKKRFALQGFFKSQDQLYRRLYAYYKNTFGIHLIGFVRDYKDYAQLEDIAKTWAEQIEVRPTPLVDTITLMDEVLGNAPA